MRDDRNRWDAPNSLAGVHTDNGITLTLVLLPRQMLISGSQVLGKTDWPIVGWPDIAPTAPYALAVRRDRLVLIDGPDIAEGWHQDTGCAISEASDAYAVFDLSGDRGFEVLQRGAELRLDMASRSVARLLFGLGVLLYRVDKGDRFRIHVASSQAEALLKSPKLAIGAVGSPPVT